MTNLSKAERAKYDIVIGSRRQVYNGTAHHTSGGLTKNKLYMTKNGRIVSKSKHFSAKKDKRLVKAGYGTKKGKFGFVLLKGHKKTKKAKKSKKSKKSKKVKKGGSVKLPLTPSDYDGAGVGTRGVAVQEEAGQAGGKRRRRKKGGHSNIKGPLSYSDYTGGKKRKSRKRKGGNTCPDGGPGPC